MNTKERTWKIINDLLQNCDCTELHITAIRYCDCKDNTDEFIAKAANSMQNVSFLPEEANKYDREAVSCRFGKKRIGYVATYDLEKCHILAEKNDTSLLTGHFGRFSANVEHHLLKLYINGVVTTDDISDYRRKTAEQKDKLYGSWQHDAIAPCLVRSRQQDDAIACISQLKERVLGLFSSWGTSTRDELTPVFEDYKDCSQYDISLEGQQSRWDILHYLELFHDSHREHGLYGDEFYKKLWQDIEDMNSQIGSELVRSVSYKSYIERLTKLVTELLPSSDTAQHYLNTKPSEFFEKIRQQVERFPHYLYHLFRTNIEEFVKTLYYARIPRQYLDPFLSGIALVQAYDKIHSSTESMSLADDSKPFNKDVTNSELQVIYNGLEEHKMLCDNPSLEDFIYWNTGRGSRPQSRLKWTQKNVCRYFVQRYHDSDWATAEQCFLCRIGNINNLKSASNIKDDNSKIIDHILKEAREKGRKNHD